MNDDEICLCGHTYMVHIDYSRWLMFPSWRCPGEAANRQHCTCEGFRLDNLRYLEILERQKNG